MERRGGCSRLGEFAKSKRISGCQRSSWEKAGFLYVPPPSNHQTSWRYNHLILHHYGLSNFIKPHTWFQLCCSITTFPLTITLDFTTLYRTASVDVLLLKRSTRTGVCSARSLPWHCLCEDVDLIFLRRPFELMLAPATSCTSGLGIGSGCGTMKCSSLGQGSLIHRENLCLAVGFLCPQQFPQGVRSWLWHGRAEARFVHIFRLTCVCLSCITLLFILGWPWSVHMHAQICVWERKSVWTVSMPLCFATYSLPESGTWCSFRRWHPAKSPVAEERGDEEKKMMHEWER